MAPADPLLSVLIPTLSSRREKLRRLLDVLLPQAEGQPGHVGIVGLHNDGEKPLAEYRQALLEDARAEYVAFVDDDDMVADDYVTSILLAITVSRPDYVAFQNAFYRDGTAPVTVLTGIHLPGWQDGPDGTLLRDVVHVNPVRAEIARQADFRRPSEGAEDWAYVEAIRPLLKTQVVIDKVLYHYHHQSWDSVQFGLAPHAYAPRLEVDSPAFRWHSWSTG